MDTTATPIDPTDEHDACAVFDSAVQAQKLAEEALRDELARIETRAVEIRKRLGDEKKPRKKRAPKVAGDPTPHKGKQRRGLNPDVVKASA
jgi:hypothetical protein